MPTSPTKAGQPHYLNGLEEADLNGLEQADLNGLERADLNPPAARPDDQEAHYDAIDNEAIDKAGVGVKAFLRHGVLS